MFFRTRQWTIFKECVNFYDDFDDHTIIFYGTRMHFIVIMIFITTTTTNMCHLSFTTLSIYSTSTTICHLLSNTLPIYNTAPPYPIHSNTSSYILNRQRWFRGFAGLVCCGRCYYRRRERLQHLKDGEDALSAISNV